ncbi:MAG: MBL fold metallo-hydrolase [Promethearchaeota archaeon]|nr:MAG: MBL fold metallo-hydrolase [Candidatus Lokiarchaeota archaeon]
MSSDFSFEIKIVYDNRCHEKDFLTGFGFSALIYNKFSGNYLLFDTGAKSDVLINNIQRFNVDISDINKVIISHSHLDHAGGLRDIYSINPKIDIFVPMGDEHAFKSAYLNAKIYGVSNLTPLEKNIYSSGQFEWSHIKEQALFLKTKENEIIVIVGCSHPGLEHFIMNAQVLGKIKAVIGGFHGFRKFSYLKDIEIIAACHCTQYIEQIKSKFPNQYKKVCVGHNLIF